MPKFNPDDYEPKEPMSNIEEGDYGFEVVDAKDQTSKSDNEMIALELAIEIPGRDKPLTVYDYLVFVEKALWKIYGFCASAGIGNKWSEGGLDADDCIGLSGTAHISLGDENNQGKRYMGVDYYKEPEGYSEQPSTASKPGNNAEAAAAHEQVAANGHPDDDIPF